MMAMITIGKQQLFLHEEISHNNNCKITLEYRSLWKKKDAGPFLSFHRNFSFFETSDAIALKVLPEYVVH